MKNTKPKVRGCLACEHGINVSLGRKHTLECRQTIIPSLVTDSLWTVKLAADGQSLKRHEHEDDDGWIRVQKLVRFTHKQPDKRADSEVKMTKTQMQSAQSCVRHHHPVLQVSNLRRNCMTHPVSMRALRRVKSS